MSEDLTELDKKLFEIVKHAADEDGYVEYEIAVREVARIKQAFIDDGWSVPDEYHGHSEGFEAARQKVSDWELQRLRGYEKAVEDMRANYMTGQEWYDRFEKEISTYSWEFDELHSILVAAREVAGLSTKDSTPKP